MDRGPVNLSTVLSRNIFSDVLYPTHSLAHSDIALASFEKYSVYMDNLIDIVFLTTQKAIFLPVHCSFCCGPGRNAGPRRRRQRPWPPRSGRDRWHGESPAACRRVLAFENASSSLAPGPCPSNGHGASVKIVSPCQLGLKLGPQANRPPAATIRYLQYWHPDSEPRRPGDRRRRWASLLSSRCYGCQGHLLP